MDNNIIYESVDESTVKFSGAMDLEPARSVGDEGEGNGVGFREAVKGERADGVDHALLDLG